jgi:hypothetical protein
LHVTTGASSSLANGIRDAARLANADPYLPVVVSNNHHSAKPKPPATFEHLGHASNVYNALIQFISIIKRSSVHSASLEY